MAEKEENSRVQCRVQNTATGCATLQRNRCHPVTVPNGQVTVHVQPVRLQGGPTGAMCIPTGVHGDQNMYRKNGDTESGPTGSYGRPTGVGPR